MNEITESMLELEKISDMLEKIKKNLGPITILGLSDVSKACIIALNSEKISKPILLVTYNELQAQNLNKNLKKLIPDIIYIPKKDIVTYTYDAQSMDILYSRMEGIIKLYENKSNIAIVSIETLMQPILSKKKMKESILKLLLANEYDIEAIKEKLVILGYERCELVEGKGTFSLRGDILDIAISNKKGIRIEFFGDEIDQIRYFEIASQRSIENINQIKIYPISEEIEKEPNGNLIEYLAENSIIAFDEISKIMLRSKNILNDNRLLMQDLVEKQKNIPFIVQHMYDMEYILKETSKFQNINLETQDIIQKIEDTITFDHDEIKKIEDKFYEITKQEKESQIYRPRPRKSQDFREAEKISFSDLKPRRLCGA